MSLSIRQLRLSVAALVLTLVALGVLPAAAQTSIQGVIGFKQQGLDDRTLMDLIRTDGSMFQLSTSDIGKLRANGVSDTVIIAMLQTSLPKVVVAPTEEILTPVTEAEPSGSQDDTGFTVAEGSEPPMRSEPTSSATTVMESVGPTFVTPAQVVFLPVYIVVPSRTGRPAAHPTRTSQPEYWGFGGQRKPGTWQDPPGVTPTRVAPAKYFAPSAAPGGAATSGIATSQATRSNGSHSAPRSTQPAQPRSGG